MQPVEQVFVLRAGGDQVDACGLNARVPEHVRELGHVPRDAVERPREQVPQVVREHLARRHARRAADGLHLRPDLPARQTCTVSGEKDLA